MAIESLNEYHESVDGVTLEKLDIYSRYLQEWLPAPLSGRMRIEEAGIYDLLCGSGRCADGSDGSPMRAVGALRANAKQLTRCADVNVRLVFNDTDPASAKSLAGRLGPQVLADDGRCLAHIQYYAQPCGELLHSLLPKLQQNKAANLLFLDQFGLCEASKEQLQTIQALKRTDLLIFVSAHWLQRFPRTREAEHWAMEWSGIEAIGYNRIHRFMANYFRSLLGNKYFVAPFSLKRHCEVYGLIFASRHPRGLEKFLEVAWHKDPYTG
ncbi:MAG: three-Cys-motif partner protein TcmP, partial [Gammaproteobacteria bacterium]